MSNEGEATNQNGDSQGDAPQNTPGHQPLNWAALSEVVHTRKIDVALWATRLLTIVFATFYMIPIMGSPNSYYYKALMANAATSALRLHQRLPLVTISRAFVAQLLMEDSCHYLFYSLIFIYCAPLGLAITPVALFAVLHFASFSLTLLDKLGRNSAWVARLFISLIDYHTATILRLAAAAEILIMVLTISYVLGGRASLVTPFIYYRFITLRYASRRNHYTRTLFYELRMTTERFIMSGSCPKFLQTILRKSIDIIIRLAPAAAPPQAN
ncbi:unnamed protein product [Orchesella dallaii]|uniref:Uncharacterized protein n=1 Tax=Orchesella dallaii TaxID=48710 RepID=A0ABP1PN23_9HEXA